MPSFHSTNLWPPKPYINRNCFNSSPANESAFENLVQWCRAFTWCFQGHLRTMVWKTLSIHKNEVRLLTYLNVLYLLTVLQTALQQSVIMLNGISDCNGYNGNSNKNANDSNSREHKSSQDHLCLPPNHLLPLQPLLRIQPPVPLDPADPNSRKPDKGCCWKWRWRRCCCCRVGETEGEED